MKVDLDDLKKTIQVISDKLEHHEEPDIDNYSLFLLEPDVSLAIVPLLASLLDEEMEKERSYYSACIFALEICVAQLQSNIENGNKLSRKTLNEIMQSLTEQINQRKHSLSFWLPILNAFYEVHVELSSELKNAYLNLAYEDGEDTSEEDIDHLTTIQEMIQEMSDLSVYEIAENFFAQSYAMPADFFSELLLDLYSIEEGQEVALLLLLHPKEDVREVVMTTFDMIINSITLSSIGLTRLQSIKNWYPSSYHPLFDSWIKIQRKKGVLFTPGNNTVKIKRIRASEVDGSGAQGLFLHIQKNKKNFLCAVLLKQDLGIKEVWVTIQKSAREISRYYNDAFDDTVTLRDVDPSYFFLMTEHFLSLMLKQNAVPSIYLLEIQELLHHTFIPNEIDVNQVIKELAIQISPFTPEVIQSSFKRSRTWSQSKAFTESWYLEHPQIDKLVNRYCSIVEGVKICEMDEAISSLFSEIFENQRSKWIFHFLWVALWIKSKAKKFEKIWQDCLLIAYALQTGVLIKEIPIMWEIGHQTILNSMETMQERRTYLTKE